MKLSAKLQRIVVSDTRGVSTLEFAIAAPVLFLIMICGIQLVMYVDAVRRVEAVATSISEMLSQVPPPVGSDKVTLGSPDIHFAYDATLVLFPYIMKDAARQNIAWWQDITIDFAGIDFVSNGKSCTDPSDQSACYTASVHWTSIGTAGFNYRPCAPAQTPVDNTATTTRSVLPRSLYGPGSIIAVDVSFKFTPTFGARYLPAVTINRSIFVQPRYATSTTYDMINNNDGIATLCPGFT